LWFSQPLAVEVREAALPPPAAGELLIQTVCSAVSAGTEMLVYRGQVPPTMALDSSIAGMEEKTSYPLPYGYACVGRVLQTGNGVDAGWQGRLVFAFVPHASHFITTVAAVIPLPPDVDPEAAVFLANLETAVNLVQDGNPQLGERVVVLGQGIVGLLLSQLLARFPLAWLGAVETMALRKDQALQAGVRQVFDPRTDLDDLKTQLGGRGADLVFEVSGAAEALDLAIGLSGFAGRIVVGSWYGSKSSTVALGGEAHRNRLQISTSQVSTIAPALSGRWDKARRFELCWQLLRQLPVQQLITHRLPLSEAPRLYDQLHRAPEAVLQALFVYTEEEFPCTA
jgi:2-desacetyl-2-hydroxyethyl bacteriochlorophyllide A dehydrogenase